MSQQLGRLIDALQERIRELLAENLKLQRDLAAAHATIEKLTNGSNN